MTKSGAGTLTLGGATPNRRHESGGTLSISSNANLGDAAGTLALGSGTLQTTASLATSRATTLNAGGGTFDTASSTTLTHSGAIDGTGASPRAAAAR